MARMGLRLAKPALIRALTPHGFVAQPIEPDLYLVRKSEIVGLYERVEFHVAGRDNEVILVALAIAVVSRVVTQMRGLLERGGLPEVCPDPTSAKVHLTSVTEAEAWAARVGAVAPVRVTALAHSRGPALLAQTAAARASAGQAFHAIVEPARDALAIREEASPIEQQTIENALTRPFVVPKGLDDAAGIAVAALVRMGDPDVIKLGDLATTPSPNPEVLIAQMLAVPDLAVWKIRVLIDMILRRDDTAGSTIARE